MNFPKINSEIFPKKSFFRKFPKMMIHRSLLAKKMNLIFLFFNQVLKYDCYTPRGCGYDDNCGIEETCVSKGFTSSDYECQGKFSLNLNYYFPKNICLSICDSVLSKKLSYYQKNVARQSCHICFRGDKNAFGIFPPTPAGPWGKNQKLVI